MKLKKKKNFRYLSAIVGEGGFLRISTEAYPTPHSTAPHPPHDEPPSLGEAADSSLPSCPPRLSPASGVRAPSRHLHNLPVILKGGRWPADFEFEKRNVGTH